MKIKIDQKTCLKHKLTEEEFLVALMYRQVKDPIGVLDNLLKREVLVFKEGQYYITQHWNEVLDEILCDSSGETRSDEDLLALAVKVQNCFPKQKMKNKYGQDTPYYYRCNRTEVKNALKRFFTYSSYKDATDDEIVDAAQRYVASFKGNYNGRMRLAKYFIWKNDTKLKEDGTGYIDQLSDLETFLENKDTEPAVTISDDWMMNARN